MQEQKSIYGIIGFPVKHSLSPLMHNLAFQELGVDAEYKLFPLEEESLPEFLNNLRESDSPIFGLNVTVPYKEKVIPFMDSLHPFAQKVNAVNTIVVSEKRLLQGFNTDGPGFLTHLTELGFSPQGKRIAILGAGGSARAIIATLCLIPERPESIRIYSRNKDKVDLLIQDLGQRLNVNIIQSVLSIDDLNVELADLLINTTSLGLEESDGCLVDEELLHSDMLVYDLIYNPAQTKLLKLAHHKGAQIANGLGMLFYQGVLAFQHWAGVELDPQIKAKMRQALEGAIS